ncbi:hypothetical protein Patl1_16862 [Pistacia atlantica]|uniref:Uncharacterized protein n=2 Tax=Pistacia atlantica TaxID=434234 RepID=A0ACC1B6Z5_9ROSI|nr:hypothetical protein Patl1_16861 [Pistacia atlantica]KAJ0094668.1 hypothetical protein Patl1_16862 [Pistacia atlantica]
MAGSKWIRPEVYPLLGALGAAVGMCSFQLVRNICINPEVRLLKEKRSAGVLDNFEEGKRYAEHGLRKFVHQRAPQIMPSINNFFSNPDLPN